MVINQTQISDYVNKGGFIRETNGETKPLPDIDIDRLQRIINLLTSMS